MEFSIKQSKEKIRPALTRSRHYPWLVVAMLSVVGCLNYLDRTMITTMRFSIIEAIPMSESQFGLLTAVFLWVYGLMSPIGGYLADRFKKSNVIIGSLLVWSLVTFLTSKATTFNQLLVTRALMGISEASYIPAALALISEYHKSTTRSLATAIHMSGIMVGQSFGFAGGWLAETHSWTYAFGFFGTIGIAYSALLIYLLRDPESVKNQAGEASRPDTFATIAGVLLRNRNYAIALTVWCLGSISSWLIVGWLPTYFKEQFGLSQTKAGIFATGYFYAASLVGVLLAGILADRWSRKNPKGPMLVSIAGMILSAPAILLASNTQLLWLALAAFIFYALTANGLNANMMPILCLIIPKAYRATGYGILNLASCVVGGIGLYAGGVLRDMNINLGIMFSVASLNLLICAWLLSRIRPPVDLLSRG